jgi:hypothetical protein
LQSEIRGEENKLLNLERLREQTMRVRSNTRDGPSQSFLIELDRLISEKNRSIADLSALNIAKIPNSDRIATLVNAASNNMEEVKKRRQKLETGFETFDQKVNQLFSILSTVLKNEKEVTDAVSRNIA